jgi:hypothetical protein
MLRTRYAPATEGGDQNSRASAQETRRRAVAVCAPRPAPSAAAGHQTTGQAALGFGSTPTLSKPGRFRRFGRVTTQGRADRARIKAGASFFHASPFRRGRHIGHLRGNDRRLPSENARNAIDRRARAASGHGLTSVARGGDGMIDSFPVTNQGVSHHHSALCEPGGERIPGVATAALQTAGAGRRCA